MVVISPEPSSRLPRVRIDFRAGRVLLDEVDAEVLGRDRDDGYVGAAMLGDIVVDLFAKASPTVATFKLAPPRELDFRAQDRLAASICAEVERQASREWRAHGIFPWGRIVLLAEWRDGGWGAFLSRCLV